MKKNNILKAFALSMIMILGLVMPMAAQNSDYFFKGNNNEEDIYENRSGDPINVTGSGITNQQFGAPLGSGLLIMVAAGAGYAVARRKRARKGMTLLLAAAMLLGMTQCKKRIENVTPSNNGGTWITLRVDDNSKVDVNSNGVVTFEDGDFIIVLSEGEPVGALLHQGGVFQGPLGTGSYIGDAPDPTEGKPLWFVFMGNTFPDDEGFVNIGEQNDNMAVLSSGASNEYYSSSVSDYSATLMNKCALVKFTLTEPTEAPVRINMVNKAQITIDPETGEIGFEPISSTGLVALKNLGNNAERWAVVLPQSSAVTNATALIGNSVYNTAFIPAVQINELNTTGTINNSGTPALTVEPYFSIGHGEIVHIASGNLQYNASTTTWRFAEKQWNYVGGTDNNNVTWGNIAGSTNNSIGDPTYTGWIDLFGWGTGNRPTLNSTDDENDYGDYYEWGQYVDDGKWFTLDEDQWDYLMDQDQDISVRYGKNGPALVHGVGGFVILPDWFECPSYTLNVDGTGPYVYHNHMDCYYLNNYSDDEWALMEQYGAVFLPVAGSRYGNSFSMGTTSNSYIPDTDPLEYAGATTAYWSSEDESDVCAYGYNYKNAMYMDKVRFSRGCAVRLVRDITLE